MLGTASKRVINHLPTGLEATGGPLGPAQPLKSLKIGQQTQSEVNLRSL